jgi:hypothetical protein
MLTFPFVGGVLVGSGLRQWLRWFSVLALFVPMSSVWGQVFVKPVEPWPSIPEPPKSKVEWVSPDMRINGIPTQLLTFSSFASLEEVIAFYQGHWDALDSRSPAPAKGDKAKSALVTRPQPDEAVIGRFHGIFYQTVHARRAGLGGSKGTLSVAMLGGQRARLDTAGVPFPQRARATGVVESADAGRISKNVQFLVPEAADQVKSYYMNRLPNQGWTLLQQHGSDRLPDGSSGHMMVFQKGADQMDVVIAEARGLRETVFRVNLIQGANSK